MSIIGTGAGSRGGTPVGVCGTVDEVPRNLDFLEMCSKFLVIVGIYSSKNKTVEEQNNIVPNIFTGGRLPKLSWWERPYCMPTVSIGGRKQT